ncbi:hypothetical protein ACLOJK_037277, partial [Asimina triloba]
METINDLVFCFLFITMPPRKVPRAIPNLEVIEALSTLPQREETRLPSPPTQELPNGMTVSAPQALLLNHLEAITQPKPDAESPVTRAEFSALVE